MGWLFNLVALCIFFRYVVPRLAKIASPQPGLDKLSPGGR
jgi:hypothetical protein